MTERAEIFRPVDSCDNTALTDACDMGHWLVDSLFTAIAALKGEQTTERDALCFLGNEITIELEAKHDELVKRLGAIKP